MGSIVENSILSAPAAPEPFVSADRAASFLDMPRKTLLGLARRGKLPAHGLPGKGRKKSWRFRLSELDHWMQTEVISGSDGGRLKERNTFR
jgi:excisionase family DNA binding protein